MIMNVIYITWHFSTLPMIFKPLQFTMTYPRVKPNSPNKQVEAPAFITSGDKRAVNIFAPNAVITYITKHRKCPIVYSTWDKSIRVSTKLPNKWLKSTWRTEATNSLHTSPYLTNIGLFPPIRIITSTWIWRRVPVSTIPFTACAMKTPIYTTRHIVVKEISFHTGQQIFVSIVQ